MSTHGPSTGMRSRVIAQRARAEKLKLVDYPGVEARPETVARLVAAKERLALGDVSEITLDIGEGLKAYGPADVETILALIAEAFAAHDAVQI